MAGKSAGLTQENKDAITRFRIAVHVLAVLDAGLQPLPESAWPTPAEKKRRDAKLSHRPKGTAGGPSMLSVGERREQILTELREATPAVLLLFQEHHCDASAVYLFLRTMNRLLRRDSWAQNDAVEAALDNLRLQATGKGEIPAMESLPDIDADDQLILSELCNSNRAMKVVEITVRDRKTVGKRLSKLKNAGLVKRLPGGRSGYAPTPLGRQAIQSSR